MSRLFVLPACLTLLYFLTGCSPPPAPTPVPQTQTVDEHPEHEHSHDAGPHGGTMVDWGGGAYHVEFTVDHEKKEATIYVLDSDEKSPRPIKADKIQLVINDPETEMELIAQPLEGEAAGSSSRFVGTHDTIGIEKEFAGTITGLIGGTPYTGDFKEEPHGADHKH